MESNPTKRRRGVNRAQEERDARPAVAGGEERRETGLAGGRRGGWRWDPLEMRCVHGQTEKEMALAISDRTFFLKRNNFPVK
jgi:hypothetical protein